MTNSKTNEMQEIRQQAIIIPGAQRSGTTTLFDLLSRHTLISEPTNKETSFFALREDIVRNHLYEYMNLFNKPDRTKYILDRS